MEIFDILNGNPILPVLVINDLNDAVAVVDALQAGGIHAVEVTLRTSKALEIIQGLRRRFPKMLIGVGTVIQRTQMRLAKEAGAQFAVSPGLTGELSDAARGLNIPYLPGVVTPSEVMAAYEMGYRCLKFFPSEYIGGIETLKAFRSVFSEVVFCPTGGIDRSNFKEYLALDNVISVGGSWLVASSELKEKGWNVRDFLSE